MIKNNIIKIALFAVITMSFTACLKERNPLVGSWEYVSINDENTTWISEDFSSFQSIVTFSSEGTFLFVDDGNKTVFDALNYAYEGRAYFGTWTEEGTEIILNVINYIPHETYTSEVTFNDGKNLSFKIPVSKLHENTTKDIPLLNYKRSDYDDLGTLISLEKNNWRVKSYQKEDKNQIKKRIEDALSFAIAFLEYHEAEEKFARTYYLKPLPLKMYGNGVVLKYYEDSEDWNELFFDEEDAYNAYEILKKGFNSVAKVPDEISENPIKINIFILKETLKNIQSH